MPKEMGELIEEVRACNLQRYTLVIEKEGIVWPAERQTDLKSY